MPHTLSLDVLRALAWRRQLDEFGQMVRYANPAAGQRKITRAFIAASATTGGDESDGAESYVDAHRLAPAEGGQPGHVGVVRQLGAAIADAVRAVGVHRAAANADALGGRRSLRVPRRALLGAREEAIAAPAHREAVVALGGTLLQTEAMTP